MSINRCVTTVGINSAISTSRRYVFKGAGAMGLDRMMELKDVNVQHFIHDTVDSLVKLDLIIFFHDKPDNRHTIEEIAFFMGRKPEGIRAELESLVQKRIIVSRNDCGAVVYGYNREREICQAVESFIDAYNDYIERLKIICILLKNDAEVKHAV